MNFIRHFGRIEVEIVVAEAGLGWEFLDGKELDGIDAETARAIMMELLEAGRVPPLVFSDRQRDGCSIVLFSPLWCGAHVRPDKAYLIAVIGSRGMIWRPAPRPS